MRRLRLASAVVLCCALASCKKPEVEVIQEGPPEPSSGPGQPGAAGSSGPAGSATPELPLALDEACKLIDAHLEYVGLPIKDRTCLTPRLQGDSVRIEQYLAPSPEDLTSKTNYNACLWRKESGDGWEVGYADGAPATCVSRERYCTVGAAAVISEVSYRACPGDFERVVARRSEVVQRLVGSWSRRPLADEPETRASRLTFGPEGTMRIEETQGAAIEGRFRILDATNLAIDVAPRPDPENRSPEPYGRTYAYALVQDTLYFGFGKAAISATRESLTLPLDAKRTLRRYRGACYITSTSPAPQAQALPCPITGEGDSAELRVRVDDQDLVFYRRGSYWMEGALIGNAYVRAARVP